MGFTLPFEASLDLTPADVGHSIWVLLLLSIESIKSYRNNPYFR